MQSYDDFIINGHWHRCECGARYSDSDGEPCHYRCANCDELVLSENIYIGICDKCRLDNLINDYSVIFDEWWSDGVIPNTGKKHEYAKDFPSDKKIVEDGWNACLEYLHNTGALK